MQNIIKKASFLSFISFYTFLLFPLSPLLAQELGTSSNSDDFGPIIQHKPFVQSVAAGEPLTIEATIKDNVAVKGAVIFYRFMGTREYFSKSMNSLGDHLYSATIPGQYVQEPGLEYYIEAVDEAGNTRTFRGFDFSPLTINIVSGSSGKAWHKKWWVWTIVGGIILSAATVAATAGSGDEAAPPPPTGTAAIDAPIP